MEKILNVKDYTLIFSDPDLILYGFIDGNLCVYMDESEEFVKSFFSKDIISREYSREKNLTNAKNWLVGILYHERKNSYDEIMSLTGYKSYSSINLIVKKFGPVRSIKEAIGLAFNKKHGESISEFMSDVMSNKWDKLDDDEDSSFRDKIRRTASEGMKRFWEEKRKRKNSY